MCTWNTNPFSCAVDGSVSTQNSSPYTAGSSTRAGWAWLSAQHQHKHRAAQAPAGLVICSPISSAEPKTATLNSGGVWGLLSITHPLSYHTATITHLYLLFYCTTVIKSILLPSHQHRHVAVYAPWSPQSLPCWAWGGEAVANPLAPRRKENGSALKEIDSVGHEKK